MSLSSVPQVLDWIENHGEAFLSKHTGVGKSLHRARALQKRHEDFEEVAQVKTIMWRTVHLSWKYMRNSCSGTEGLGRGSSTTKNSVPRMDYFVSVAAFISFPVCIPSSIKKKDKLAQACRGWEPWSPTELLLLLLLLLFIIIISKTMLSNPESQKNESSPFKVT